MPSLAPLHDFFARHSTCRADSPMTICVTPATPSHAHSDTCIRVMRWTFRRDHETIVCELGLNETRSAYQICLTPARSPLSDGPELFDDAMSAFQRHTAIERQLVGDGWSLESFESERIPR
jgi:hypothetical protein